MLPDRVSNPGPLTYESGALPIALRGPAAPPDPPPPDIIENSRIKLRGVVLPAPSNQIKVTFIIILPFNLIHL